MFTYLFEGLDLLELITLNNKSSPLTFMFTPNLIILYLIEVGTK